MQESWWVQMQVASISLLTADFKTPQISVKSTHLRQTVRNLPVSEGEDKPLRSSSAVK
jgi:hypothetical protein